MQIIDSVLKNILSANASNKMKNIVNTIQKEQNSIIRKNDVDLLIVQGPAGSGKTSIAMHKIAYLLYSERDKINNSNVMILSPNDIFNNYISDVLPEIGEDNVAQATYFDFAKAFITEFHISTKIEDVYEVVYGETTAENKAKFNEIKFKCDPIYTRILKDYIKLNRVELLGLEEIVINDEVVMSLDEISKIAISMKGTGESLYSLGKKIIERIYYVAATKTQKHLTLEKLKKQALENLTKAKLKVASLYRKLYSNKEDFINFVTHEFERFDREDDLKEFDLDSIFELTKTSLSKDSLEYQDVTPYMYLKSRIIGISANKNIKYVLIDEAQDYSITQYKILAMMFRNSNITLLGDLNQSILPFNNHIDYNEIESTIKKFKQHMISNQCELSKTYRSTFEINEFAKMVLDNNKNYTQIDRHGDPVEVIKQNNFDINQILNDAITLKKSYNTVAIICKNIEETLLYKEKVLETDYLNKFRLVTKNDNVFVGDKIMIIPSYLAKGLEFDAVIVSNANNEIYRKHEDKLFYVVLTRALHKLKIYHTGEFTKLISGDKNEEISR